MPLTPGVYDIPTELYYADELDELPTLNGTVAKLIIAESPLHAWTEHPKLNPDYAAKVDKKFDVGTAAHALFLQGELVTEEETSFTVGDDAVCVGVLVNVDGKPFALVTDAADWRTNAAKAVRSEARARGLVPLLDEQWQQTRALSKSIRGQLSRIAADPPLFAAGKPERTLVWQDRGVWCRARMDWLHDSLECCDDLKTAARSANSHVWARSTMWGIGADIQAAFTLRGLRAALGVESTFRFVIAETHAPYAIAAVTPSSQALELADAKIDKALARWKECLAADEWPAYTPHVLTVDPPPWHEMQWMEAQALEEEVAAA